VLFHLGGKNAGIRIGSYGHPGSHLLPSIHDPNPPIQSQGVSMDPVYLGAGLFFLYLVIVAVWPLFTKEG
jgi:hypothetical protein